jgi:hypothetical protein
MAPMSSSWDGRQGKFEFAQAPGDACHHCLCIAACHRWLGYLLGSDGWSRTKGENSLRRSAAADLVLGYHKANSSPLLKLFLSRTDELIARVSKRSGELGGVPPAEGS